MTLTLATCFSAIIIVEQLGFRIRGPGCLECNIFCNTCVIGLSYYIFELHISVVPTKLGRVGYQSLFLKCGVEDPSSAMAVVNWSEFLFGLPRKTLYAYIPSFTTSKGNGQQLIQVIYSFTESLTPSINLSSVVTSNVLDVVCQNGRKLARVELLNAIMLVCDMKKLDVTYWTHSIRFQMSTSLGCMSPNSSY